jgi:hypothetical protein
LAEAVAGVPEVRGRQRMQTKHTEFFRKRPFGIVGHVIPLPMRIHFATVEIIVQARMPTAFGHAEPPSIYSSATSLLRRNGNSPLPYEIRQMAYSERLSLKPTQLRRLFHKCYFTNR